jgi:hypothetical protein
MGKVGCMMKEACNAWGKRRKATANKVQISTDQINQIKPKR